MNYNHAGGGCYRRISMSYDHAGRGDRRISINYDHAEGDGV